VNRAIYDGYQKDRQWRSWMSAGNTHYFYVCGIAARYQKRKGSVPDFPLPGRCHNERDNNTHVGLLVPASGHRLESEEGFEFFRLTLDTLIAQPSGNLQSSYIRAQRAVNQCAR
jgi:hypothetical protein